jgi:hypothetical protein
MAIHPQRKDDRAGMTKKSFAFLLVGLIGVSLFAIGTSAVIVPDLASQLYGVAADTGATRTYVQASGLRDLAIGVWLLSLLALRVGPRIVGISVLALALIPLGDAAIVASSDTPRNVIALALHSLSLIVFLFLGWWLYRSDQGQSSPN